MRKAALSLGLSLHLVIGSAAGAAPLEPVKPWNIHFNDTDCLAERPYGSVTDGIVLGFRPSPAGNTYELIVARKGSGDKFASQLRASVDFGQGPIKASALRYHPTGTELTLDKYQVSKADVAAGTSAQSITFRNDRIGVERFTLSAFPQVLKTLDQCNDDLRKFWNMTNDLVVTEAKTPGDLRRIFTANDYPDEAMSRDVQGEAQFLILVSEKGAVANCYVAKASGSPALDGMGCQVIMQRAKFTPAKDRAGKPIRSAILSPPIIWRIEG